MATAAVDDSSLQPDSQLKLLGLRLGSQWVMSLHLAYEPVEFLQWLWL